MIRKRGISLAQQGGQSLVEFALVTLFVILPVTFGIIDGGILFYKWVALTNGAREVARTGAIYHFEGTAPAVGPWDDVVLVDTAREEAIKEGVNATIGPLVSIQEGDWEISYDPEYRCVVEKGGVCVGYDVYRKGALVTVQITHYHTPFVGLVIGLKEKIHLTAAATMKIEPGLPVSP